jgi:arylsulfatase A-like enzyme
VARIRDPVQQIDVLPTLLGLMGIRSSIALPGRDLSAWWLGRAQAPRTLPLLFAEERFTVTNKDAVRLGSLKLIVNNDGRRLWRAGTYLELYDLAHDPSERDNLRARLPITRTFLYQQLRRFLAEQSAAATKGRRLRLSDDERDELRALGYIE